MHLCDECSKEWGLFHQGSQEGFLLQKAIQRHIFKDWLSQEIMDLKTLGETKCFVFLIILDLDNHCLLVPNYIYIYSITWKFKKVDAFESGNADNAAAYAVSSLPLLRIAHGHSVQSSHVQLWHPKTDVIKWSARTEGHAMRKKAPHSSQLSRSERMLLGKITSASKTRDWQAVCSLFENYPGKAVAIYTAAMNAAFRCQKYQEGASIYKKCERVCQNLDEPVFSAGLRLFGKLGEPEEVRQVWDTVIKKGNINDVLAASRINAAADEGDVETAAAVLDLMQEKGIQLKSTISHQQSELAGALATNSIRQQSTSFSSLPNLAWSQTSSLLLLWPAHTSRLRWKMCFPSAVKWTKWMLVQTKSLQRHFWRHYCRKKQVTSGQEDLTCCRTFWGPNRVHEYKQLAVSSKILKRLE